jgi:hypothetical protein
MMIANDNDDIDNDNNNHNNNNDDLLMIVIIYINEMSIKWYIIQVQIMTTCNIYTQN